MRKYIAVILLGPMGLSGCATIHRHPILFVVAGVATGVGVGLATRGHGHCPTVYDGHPYNGTPPCPQDYPDPKRR